MRIKFFQVPVFSDGTHENEFNDFLQSHRISNVRSEFVANGESSFWAIKVDYGQGRKESGKTRERIDYKEVLGEEEFAQYSRLRELRKGIAEAEGLPAYAIFTNEQLARMVREKVRNPEQLKSLDGIGEQKASKYGERFLECLKREF